MPSKIEIATPDPDEKAGDPQVPGPEPHRDSAASDPSPWENEEYIACMEAAAIARTEHLLSRAEKSAESVARHRSFQEELDLLAHQYAAFIKVELDDGSFASILGPDGDVNDGLLKRFTWLGEAELSQAMTRSLAGEALDRVERAAAFDPPIVEHESLAELLAVELPELQYRVDGLMLLGGITLLSAPAKAAKTTCVMCLCRSLLDGHDFLGRKVRPIEEGRRIVYWDLELETRYAVQQFARLGIARTDAISLIPMKGYSVPLTTAEGKDWAVAHLRRLRAEVWVIDTFSRVFGGDENSNTEINAFLRDLDEIKRRADLREIVIIHHAGHEQKNKPQRARGASALEGWPDTLLTIERVNPNNAEDTQRTLRAKGRGVTVPELHYDWDPDAFELEPLTSVRRVSAGSENRKNEKQRTKSDVHMRVVANPRSIQTDIAKALGITVNKVRAALGDLVDEGEVTFETGDGRNGSTLNAKYYTATDKADIQ